MSKWGIFLFLAVFISCSNPNSKKEPVVNTASRVKTKTPAIKPAINPWSISAFAAKEGEAEGKKFVRFISEGNFSDSLQTNGNLYVEVIFNKVSAGIFLHERKKSSPAVKFNDPVQIKMTNSSGEELHMTSSRRWNNSGGILIEQNNNDYSQFRIFLLQNKGTLTVEIKDSGNKSYHFSINADGFGDSFTRL